MRQVCMHFMQREEWYCQFLEADCKTCRPRKVTFKTSAEVQAMIERVAPMTGDEVHDFERAVATGAAASG